MTDRNNPSGDATAELAAHLKASAHEALAAAHAALDVMEALVDDPSPVARVVNGLVGALRAARGGDAATRAGRNSPGDEERGRVEHIRVS